LGISLQQEGEEKKKKKNNQFLAGVEKCSKQVWARDSKRAVRFGKEGGWSEKERVKEKRKKAPQQMGGKVVRE